MGDCRLEDHSEQRVWYRRRHDPAEHHLELLDHQDAIQRGSRYCLVGERRPLYTCEEAAADQTCTPARSQLTAPAILLLPYLDLPYDTVVKLGLLRAQDVELGIVAALLLNITLWPYHARVQLVVTCAKVRLESDCVSRSPLSTSAYLPTGGRQAHKAIPIDVEVSALHGEGVPATF